MSWLNIANLISLARLLTAPLVWREILDHREGTALVLCLAAGLSDGMDGWLARRFGQATRAGAYLDPIADKVFLAAAFVALAIAGLAPAWLVVLIFGRDLLILAIALSLLTLTHLRDFSPSRWGKLSTVLQVSLVLAVLAERVLGQQAAWSIPLVWGVACMTSWSGVDYGLRTFKQLRTLRVNPD